MSIISSLVVVVVFGPWIVTSCVPSSLCDVLTVCTMEFIICFDRNVGSYYIDLQKIDVSIRVFPLMLNTF